jgi:hypothetical protein
MKAADFLKIVLIISIFVFGCKNEPELKPLPDPRYPTTYLQLSTTEWNAKNNEFQKINIYQGLSLNKYGFVEGEIPININNQFNVGFVKNEVEALVSRYKLYMGISLNTTNDLSHDLYMEIFSDKFPDFSLQDQFAELELNGSSVYQGSKFKIFLPQKKIGNEEIYYMIPSIIFNFKENEGLLQIKGNWFSEAFLPEKSIITLDEAISSANKAIIEKTGIDVIKTKSWNTASQYLYINYTNSKIEIRKCWGFDAMPLCILFIDNQTGEMVSYRENVGNNGLSRFLEID